VQELSNPKSYNSVIHRSNHNTPMPSVETLNEIVEDLRAIIFPGYFGQSELTFETIKYYTGAMLDEVHRNLSEQILRGMCFECNSLENTNCDSCAKLANQLSLQFLLRLTELRKYSLQMLKQPTSATLLQKAVGKLSFATRVSMLLPTTELPTNFINSKFH